ncbi:MAG: 7-carboxy-7-deazaguanine synthase QueE [Campylobacterales bacterium]
MELKWRKWPQLEGVELGGKLVISELFYSLQGEGPKAGIPSLFLRLGGCNLRCPRFPCDTYYSVLPCYRKKWREMGWQEIFREFRKLVPTGSPPPNLVVTGGEPLLQQELLGRGLPYYPGPITIETNGTILPEWGRFPIFRQLSFAISPKLSNSGEPKENRWKPEVLAQLGRISGSYFKVVLSPEDLPGIGRELEELKNLSPETPIYCMPMARNRGELEERGPVIARFALEKGYRYSDRLQLRLGLK